MNRFILVLCILTMTHTVTASEPTPWPEHINTVLEATAPLKHARGNRLPLYVWAAQLSSDMEEADIERLARALDSRGVGLIATWKPNRREQCLELALRIARVQTRLGLRVNVNANACLYSFFDGSEATAHIDDKGKRFWDTSFGNKPMGCPFTLDQREPAIRERIAYYVAAYKKAGVNLDFVFADWEIDGPMEFNKSHAFSRRCVRCREHIKEIDDFTAFQKALRVLRSELQKRCYAEPILDVYPKCLVGNYAVYPHDGWRYWYDYFEYFVEGQPHKIEGKARYRRWYNEFPLTDYTFAMPVVYTWDTVYDWYDFADTDYRWFYNMLKVASNVGQHTPVNTPIISFVHWHTVDTGHAPGPTRQMSEDAYRELLWHMYLRGIDGLFIWSPSSQAEKEIRLVHPVYAEMQEYGEFIDKGEPVTFDVPARPAPVISGLRLDHRVLIRRTDFGADRAAIPVKIGSSTIEVPSRPGRMQVFRLP